MESVLDQLFPLEEDPQVDVLAGLPDFTFGVAKNYFAGLAEEDREIVQWYLMQNMDPEEVEGYTKELVHGYALVDPDRTADAGKAAAHAELARVRRFLELFLASEDFFPAMAGHDERVTDDETGDVYTICVQGWLSLGPINEVRRRMGAKDIMNFMDLADRFIDNPADGLPILDQEAILSKRHEEIDHSNPDWY